MDQMNLVPVSSSFISQIGYNEETRMLFVEIYYTSGASVGVSRIYPYQGVPKETFDQFLAAPSKGIFYNVEIKGYYTSI